MKIFNFFCCILLHVIAPAFLQAQKSSFIYELNYRPLSDSVKKEKITFYLDIKDNESLFRSDKFRYSDSLRVKKGFGNGFDMEYNNKQLYIYKKAQSNEVLKYVFVPLISTTYAIPIDEKLNWIVLEEKDKIGNYNCQKAEVYYGGRKWIAWFTSEIPLQEGPYVFKGLPGLVVKIFDDKFNYDFELNQIIDFKWDGLYAEKFQKKISWKEFQKLQKNFYDDPFSMINKSEITSYDEGGNTIKTNFKEMKENTQKRIKAKNNPIELNYKVEFK
ncbi:GLPGLI family protein [Chryseobacterium sp. PS-8]|uniref:GLPGLI family protein n=1 Tax=Chryseobacterium indicum TaxID=2766954 RepID=A0ABS9CC78_9FLAO|nr:GLPGLI family protein [Chryseobacterium sp. PS-8]MCF2220966.1 GLPGLI family protein [Chryseobacterium sp. PS-8]